MIEESLRQIDLNLLRTFAVIAEEKSFTIAAKKLSLTQSAISMKLKKLEDLFQHKLIERSTRSFELTLVGDTLYGYAQKFLSLHDEMVENLRAPQKQEKIRIGIADHAVHLQLALLLKIFMGLHREAEVHIETGPNTELLESLQQGQLDFVICHKEKNYPSAFTLVKENLVWIVSTKSADKMEKEMLLKNEIPLALLPSTCQYRDATLRALKKAKKKWRLVFSSASLAGIQAAVESGFAYSVLPITCVPAGAFSFLESEHFPRLPTMELCLYGDGVSNLKRAFIKAVRLHFQSISY